MPASHKTITAYSRLEVRGTPKTLNECIDTPVRAARSPPRLDARERMRSRLPAATRTDIHRYRNRVFRLSTIRIGRAQSEARNLGRAMKTEGHAHGANSAI